MKKAEWVAGELRREIVTGAILPGAKLHTEAVLQAQFGVSKPTLREAVRLLEADTLVSVKRGQFGGITVTPLDPRVAARQVGMCLQMEGTTLEDVWHARLALEPMAVRCLALRGDKSVLDQLEGLVSDAEASLDDMSRYGSLRADFSRVILTRCGNNTLQLLGLIVDEISKPYFAQARERAMSVQMGDLTRRSLDARRKLLGLLRQGKADEAEVFWRGYTQTTAEVTMSLYRAKTPINVFESPSVARQD